MFIYLHHKHTPETLNLFFTLNLLSVETTTLSLSHVAIYAQTNQAK